MNQSELKQLIKSYVREAVNEVLAEKFMKSMIRECVKEALVQTVSTIKEEVQVHQPQSSIKQQLKISNAVDEQKRMEEYFDRRRKMMDETDSRRQVQKPVIKESLTAIAGGHFQDIFEDTLKSNHPLITGADNGQDVPVPENLNEIPEEIMEAAGIFSKDYSRHIGIE
jgi:hypothetical protein